MFYQHRCRWFQIVRVEQHLFCPHCHSLNSALLSSHNIQWKPDCQSSLCIANPQRWSVVNVGSLLQGGSTLIIYLTQTKASRTKCGPDTHARSGRVRAKLTLHAMTLPSIYRRSMTKYRHSRLVYSVLYDLRLIKSIRSLLLSAVWERAANDTELDYEVHL
jgi:hypothetical protein